MLFPPKNTRKVCSKVTSAFNKFYKGRQEGKRYLSVSIVKLTDSDFMIGKIKD